MEKGKNPNSRGSRSSYVDEQKVEGGSIAAVPSIALEQTFLHKCVDCAFNRLDEKISLHSKACGLLRGNRLLLTAA